jgi:starch synthase (maltosyl-transferring)
MTCAIARKFCAVSEQPRNGARPEPFGVVGVFLEYLPVHIAGEFFVPLTSPRICHAGTAPGKDEAREAIARAAALGFSHILFRSAALADGRPIADGPPNGSQSLRALAQACAAAELGLLLDLDVSELALDHPLVKQHPECFSVAAQAASGFVDPRLPNSTQTRARARPQNNAGPFVAWWSEALGELRSAGIKGFRIVEPQCCGAAIWRDIIAPSHKDSASALFIADTSRLPRNQLGDLRGAGFDFCLSALPWWDGRAAWFAEQHEAASAVAPVIALVEAPEREPPAACELRRSRLAVATVTGEGALMPLGFEQGPSDASIDLALCVKRMNALLKSEATNGAFRSLTGPGDSVTVVLRTEEPDERVSIQGLVVLINPHPTINTPIGAGVKAALGEWGEAEPIEPFTGPDGKLAPGEARLFRARRTKPIICSTKAPAAEARAAAQESRIVIGNIAPCVDGGAYPAKRIVGETVSIEADIFPDGHPVIAAELLTRADDERGWRRRPMQPLGNDRWSAPFVLERIGRHRFAIEAWLDVYGTFVRDLAKKRAAGVATLLDIEEGRALIEAALTRAGKPARNALATILAALDSMDRADRMILMLAPETIEAVRRADARPSKTASRIHCIEAERISARFASWYELFPRSQTDDPQRHGTLTDVMARLPAIAAMGFDVLYLTPIHPVGATNRKGRNNALTAEEGDPGSVYAIGSPSGGHTAIHPQLGTLADFQALVTAAHKHGMEIALDFAIQVSPDHPWLKEYPGWFDWRPDGSVKYAENPPKQYEDIVNVDFYAKDAVPDLWLALRFVVLFWIEQGVRLFRVDNPHTKPFAFWRWMIGDLRGLHPDVIFLSEAFTRPKVMYHLAKLGFSQSYTYFTWRNSKTELTAYIQELTSPPVADFFRPHFFVNTPDINPVFLQTSGRAGFLIRAALAATLSGLWGMYSGFELCEAEALPGREEYKDSEKYQIKPRDWNAPGNIVPEIAALNRLRRAEPALQTHLGVTFYNAFNGNILYFGKHAPESADRILVAISLNPHGPEEADFEIPLWEWGLPDSGALLAQDVLRGGSFVWHGKMQHMRLTPVAPYAVWRARPAEVA